MGMMSWIVMGLIAGVLAKWIMPGKDPGGIIVMMLIGIAGAFVGGYIGTLVGLGSVSGFDLVSLALARISHQDFGFRCICSVSECTSGLKSIAVAMV